MDRTLQTVIVASALVGLIAWQRPAQDEFLVRTGVNVERFWAEKAHVSRSEDIVLAGDSRIYDGLSPRAMEVELRGQRIRNLGFSGVGLSEPYLAFVEQALAPNARTPMIVVGMSPHAFTPHAAKMNGYLTESRRTTPDVCERLYLSPVRALFRPLVDPEAPATPIPSAKQPHYYRELYADGWIASDMNPREPNDAIPAYEDAFKTTRVDDGIVRDFVKHVGRWTKMGIRVIGFRPPVSDALFEVEQAKAGYDESSTRAAFESAGGTYLAIDREGYETYDGGHLTRDSAVKLSHDLGAEIARERR